MLGLTYLLGLEGELGAGTSTQSPLLAKAPHFAPRAKRVVFMHGGPSHIDTFDPKPRLEQWAGQRGGLGCA